MKTTQDLLNLPTGTVKTVLLEVGLPKRKRLKVIVKEDSIKIHNFLYHNQAAGGRDVFPKTPEGMVELDNYIKQWFSEKNKPSKYKSTGGWAALENIMNKTWSNR